MNETRARVQSTDSEEIVSAALLDRRRLRSFEHAIGSGIEGNALADRAAERVHTDRRWADRPRAGSDVTQRSGGNGTPYPSNCRSTVPERYVPEEFGPNSASNEGTMEQPR